MFVVISVMYMGDNMKNEKHIKKNKMENKGGN